MSLPGDTGRRGEWAVGVSISLDHDDCVFVFDDLKLDDENGSRRNWKHHVFVTTAVIEREKFNSFSFKPEELQSLGELLVSMLRTRYREQRDDA